MSKIYKKYVTIFYIIIFIVIFMYLVNNFLISKINGFSNYNLKHAGSYPKSDNVPILSGDYTYSGNKNVSHDNYNDIWWYYPIFKVGNYKQLTNNLRYWKNPDEGTCIRSEFCGALYKDKSHKPNVILPLPEAKNGPGPRVNYYRTDTNVFPHTTNNFSGLY